MTQDKDTVTIVLNLREREVPKKELSPGDEISYDLVLKMAQETLPSGPYIEYEIFYEKALARPTNGELKEGESVKIEDGTVFNVTYTDKS